MKKSKAKPAPARKPRATRPSDDDGILYEKAALRSQAFARAILNAKGFANNPERLNDLFQEAARKAATLPKEPFRDTWAYLQAMLRLVRAYHKGEYRFVPKESLLTIIAALNYLIDPFDLIPDEIPFLGFLDDATVIAFAVGRAREALEDFMTWETSAA